MGCRMVEAYRTIEVRPIAGPIGAEIHGIDLAHENGPAELAELRRAYDAYGVIFSATRT